MILLKRSYLIVVAVTALVLSGWVFDLEVFQSVLPGLETMKPATALCFLLCVGAIHYSGFVSAAGLGVVLIVSLMHVYETLTGQLFFPESSSLTLRMSGATVFLFVAISVTIGLSKGHVTRAQVRMLEIIVIGALFVCFTALLGFLLDYKSFNSISFFSSMALHTAFCFAVLFSNLFLTLIKSRYSVFNLVHSDNMGGRIILRRWLFTVLTPAIVSGILITGTALGYYDLGFAFVLLAAFSSIFTTWFLFRKARVIEQFDVANQALLYEKEKVNDDLQILNQALNEAQNQLKQKNEELVRTVERLYIRNKELDLFTYHTSHDIRAPLASILGIASIAMTESDGEKMKEYITVIENRGKRLDKFIHQMIMFTRNDRTPVQAEKVEVAELVEECLVSLKGDPLYRNLRIEKHFSLENPVVILDKLRISQIFQNLLNNAVKFQNTQLEDNYLIISVLSGGGFLRIIFEDNGIGIKKEYLPKMFQMFQRATDRVEGSGLGLYIVKQMVTKLGGDIKLSSEYGKGTKVEIDFSIENLESGIQF
ncbi:MAG: HAMP domain-containing sensor histidine kinase [Imperialibacter sp.]|uniref:sensor histidine kinase n=1 Tax=Imperialibacter sp. TaxID=2038411 RepID=UPI0032EAD959